MILGWLKRVLGPAKPLFRVVDTPEPPRLVIAKSCFDGLLACLGPAVQRHHEGVALLLGRGDGSVKIALHCVRPVATTSAGSFAISAQEMARVIRLAMQLGLEIVAQVHTHPVEAFHSRGDEEGARIRYHGYVSLVIPEYGIHLPRLTGAAAYVFTARGWQPMSLDDVQIIEAATVL